MSRTGGGRLGRLAGMAAGWGQVFRSAPIGVLVLGVLLLFVGAAFILGGVFFALSATAASWLGWMLMIGVGPLFLYVALHFVMLRRWAWLVVVLVLGLMLLSSLARTVTTVGVPITPLAEIAAELLGLAYLLRPRIRAAFRAR